MTTESELRIAAARQKLQAGLRGESSSTPNAEDGRDLSTLSSAAAAAHEAREADIPLAFDPSSNLVASVLEDGKLTEEEKIRKIAAFLTPEKASGEEDAIAFDFASVREKFAAFQAAFNFYQSQGLLENSRKWDSLIDEIVAALRPEFEQITHDIVRVQETDNAATKLLDVLRLARQNGKTIEEISEALARNRELSDEIQQDSIEIDSFEVKKKAYEKQLTEEEKRREASKQGGLNRLARSLFGPDKGIEASITALKESLRKTEDEITRSKKQLADKEANLDKELEAGPLVILRSLDATEQSLSDQIVENAKEGQSLITRAIQTVQRLEPRVEAFDRTARAIESANTLSQKRKEILSAAVALALEEVGEGNGALKAHLKEVEAQLAGLSEESGERAIVKLDLLDAKTQFAESQAYGNALSEQGDSFRKIEADKLHTKNTVNGLIDFIHGQRVYLAALSNEILPAISNGLLVRTLALGALQVGEYTMSMGGMLSGAYQTQLRSLKDLTRMQTELHDSNKNRTEGATDSIGKAEEIVLGQIEATVAQRIENKTGMENLGKAIESMTKALQELTEMKGDVPTKPQAGNDNAAAGPSEPSGIAGPKAALGVKAFG